MNHSTELGELFAALAAAQAELPMVQKDKENPFYKSKYADLASCVEAAKPVLPKHGLCVTQLIGNDGAGHDTLTTVLGHSSGQWLSGDMVLHPVKNDPQAQGSAVTYGRRYAYCSILGLVAEDDDDGNAASKPKTQRRTTTAERPPQVRTEAPSGQPSPYDQARTHASIRGLTQAQWTAVLKTHRQVNAENLAAVMASINEVEALGAPFSEGAA